MSHHSYLPVVLLTFFAYDRETMAHVGEAEWLKSPAPLGNRTSYYTFMLASQTLSFIWALLMACNMLLHW